MATKRLQGFDLWWKRNAPGLTYIATHPKPEIVQQMIHDWARSAYATGKRHARKRSKP